MVREPGKLSSVVLAACSECGGPMRRSSQASGIPRCRQCRQANPKSRLEMELGRYGVDLVWYERTLAEQDYRCGICRTDKPGGSGKRFHVDHDHNCCPTWQRACGKCVRGLLCAMCNQRLEFSWKFRDGIAAWVRRSITAVAGFDLDSTLCDTTIRQGMVPEIKAGLKTWDDYSMACASDVPISGVVQLARLLWPGYKIWIMSGRSECARNLTTQWLDLHAVPYDNLLLRPDDDSTENGLLKVRWIKELEAAGLSLSLMVEDWPVTAETIRAATDVKVLVPNPCYAPEVKAAAEYRGGTI